jgi:hypothetical protein
MGSGGIRERFPELCCAIVAKRKQQVLRKKEEMRRALEEARAETPPPSLKQIGRRLGYTAECAVVGTFPDLCHSHKELSCRASVQMNITEQYVIGKVRKEWRLWWLWLRNLHIDRNGDFLDSLPYFYQLGSTGFGVCF